MTHPALIERITRSLAYMLRHQPEKFDLDLDEDGFGELSEVVRAVGDRLAEPVEAQDVVAAVEAGDRPRYEIKGSRIRALYGHSIEVRPGEPAQPPEFLYVGIDARDLDRAKQFGLRGGRRRFLHLALSADDAREAGRRAAREYAILQVFALDAWEEGVNFYDRKTLYLCEQIPTKHLDVLERAADGYEPRQEAERADGPSRRREERPERRERREEPARLPPGDTRRREERPRVEQAPRAPRDERSFRDDRGPREERPVREERAPREERPVREESGFRAERGPREERGFRDDRPVRDERAPRQERPFRDERAPREERPFREERAAPREERPIRDERAPREERPFRDERAPREERPFREDRGRRDDRGFREERPQRDERRAPARFDAPPRPEAPRESQPMVVRTQHGGDNSGFGLGIFEEEAKASAPKPKPAPAPAPRPAPVAPPAPADDDSGFGAGI